jgi:hypothetical protein
MVIKYNANIKSSAINNNLKRLTNQIYKLLPMREENLDWQKPLGTVVEELAGMDKLLIDQQEILFSLLCKLEGLFALTEEKDFLLFRRVIFECLGMMSNLKEICQD